jgi:hypothetical protein
MGKNRSVEQLPFKAEKIFGRGVFCIRAIFQ